jgi:N-acetylglucosamine kinase-like BadF-type ATPase
MKGDKTSKRIVEEMIDEMDCSIKAAAKRVGIKDNLNVVLVGGAFRSKLPILKDLKTRVSKWMKHVNFVFPKEEPAVAAFHFALDNYKKSLKTK